jgi:uncharacterized cupin superfamily protein
MTTGASPNEHVVDILAVQDGNSAAAPATNHAHFFIFAASTSVAYLQFDTRMDSLRTSFCSSSLFILYLVGLDRRKEFSRKRRKLQS